MNLLWKGPALRWTPFSGAGLAVLLYLAAGAFARAQGKPEGSVFLPLFAALFLPFPKHVFARFALPERTEWLMGLGLDRRRLAFRFAVDLVWWSGVHAAGGACLLAVVPEFKLFHQSEWGQGHGILQIGIAIFLVQLTTRSLFAIVAHGDRSTLLSPRMMDAFGGVYASFRSRVGWFFLGLLMLAGFSVAPVVLVAVTRSFLWLAVPAALYLRLAHALAASSEFVRKTTPPVDDWGLPVPAASPPPREFFGGLRSDRAAAAPLRGLLWDGTAGGVRIILFWLLGILLGMGAWWMATLTQDRNLPGIFIAVCVAMILAFFAFAGQKVFAWTRSDEAVEYLFVRGVTLRTLDRVRMTWAMLVTGAALGFTVYLHQEIQGWREATDLPLWAVVLYVGAALLLECNRRALPRRFLRWSTYSDLGRVLRGGWFIIFAVMGGLGVRVFGARSPVWLGVGLFLFVPALVAWLRTFVRLLVRR